MNSCHWLVSRYVLRIPLVLPITKGNVVKTFIIGFVVLAIGLYFVTDLAPYFTKAAHDVYAKTQDAAVNIPSGF